MAQNMETLTVHSYNLGASAIIVRFKGLVNRAISSKGWSAKKADKMQVGLFLVENDESSRSSVRLLGFWSTLYIFYDVEFVIGSGDCFRCFLVRLLLSLGSVNVVQGTSNRDHCFECRVER